MKNIYLLISIFIINFVFGQPTATYYNNATGTGLTLKTQLKTIITNGHVDQGYGSLWNLYDNTAFRDNDYENDGTLLDLYSEKSNATDAYNYSNGSQQCGNIATEGSCYNREHLIPQSYFDNTAVNPMKNDPHHVKPSDGKVNGWRNNYPFGVVEVLTVSSPCNSGATNMPCNSTNGSKKGLNKNSGYSSGYSGIVFEPIDEFKGDVARSFFYFATRYENQMSQFYTDGTAEAKVMFDGTNNNAFSTTFLEILKQWHLLDPVSPHEIAANNAIFNYQGNRNPFIDNPSYVTAIWGQPTFLEIANFNILNSISVYPNPSYDKSINIHTDVIIDEIILINVNGQIMQNIKKPLMNDKNFILENLSSGFYFLKLTTENQTITKKIIVN